MNNNISALMCGLDQWSVKLPQKPKVWVRIPPGFKAPNRQNWFYNICPKLKYRIRLVKKCKNLMVIVFQENWTISSYGCNTNVDQYFDRDWNFCWNKFSHLYSISRFPMCRGITAMIKNLWS
jgi:hypothetical protein